jgi:hypothetical protein
MLEVNGKKYGRIYLVRSDVESKSLFLNSLGRITSAHNKVDVLLAIHGGVGSWQLSPDLRTNLTGNELVSFATSQLTLAQRNKVRAVFSTACYAASGSLPMTSAVTQAFPSSVTYGSLGINWGPMHRDFTAFEAYYAGRGFSDSVVNMGNYVLTKNTATGGPRSHLNFPTVLGRGCVDLIFGSHCQNETRSLGRYQVLYGSFSQVAESEARLASGPTGNLNTVVAATCVHPDTGARVIEGTTFTYFTVASLPSTSSLSCSSYRQTATCTATGNWSAPILSPRYATCVKPPRTTCGRGLICMEP